MRPLVGVIILNWNRSRDTERAALSVLHSGYEAVRVIVVDNGSAGDDVAFLRRLDPRIRVVALERNQGFARGVNIGAHYALAAGARHLLLFNNDAYFFRADGVIELLVGMLESEPLLGAVGPCIVNDDSQRTVQSCGLRYSLFFPVPRGVGRGRPYAARGPGAPRIDYLMGSCLLIRGSAFVAVNGLNSDLFFLGDDIDLMLRLRKIGLREAVVPGAAVTHRKSSTIREGSARYAYSAVRSNLIVLATHARWWHWPSAFFTMLAISFALTWRSATSLRGAGPLPVLRAWRDFFRHRWGGYDGRWPPGYAPIDFRLASRQAPGYGDAAGKEHLR